MFKSEQWNRSLIRYILVGMAEHKHSPAEEKKIRDAALDETLKQSFPASDPPSTDPNPDNDELLEDR